MYIGASIASVGLVGLCGYVIYLWQASAKKETKRLYAWLDDIRDRIGSENVERYALCRRVKYEMGVQSVNVNTKIEKDADKDKEVPQFVHSKR